MLDWYHNLNEIHPFDVEDDYSDYYIYCFTRNPYTRVVSAFLDQFVYARNEGVQAMMNIGSATRVPPNNFIEFLEYLASVPDEKRDTHFQTQGFFPYLGAVVTPQVSLRYRFLGQKPKHAFGINSVSDISQFQRQTKKVFKRVFKTDKKKHSFALRQLEQLTRKNSSFYGEKNYPLAATLSTQKLNNFVFAPKPQDFFVDKRAVELVNEIYQDDFTLFGYAFGDIPIKPASKERELIPDDFDWEMYLRLNPDLPPAGINNERSVVRHYLEFGRFESTPRAYKIEAPDGFDWKCYLKCNSDLKSAGIKTQEAVIEHYISYGIREGRPIR